MPEVVPEPLRTVEPPAPAAPTPPRTPGSGYTYCDFCQCKLATDGKVLVMSPEAEAYRDGKSDHAKAVKKLDEQIAELRQMITAKEAEITALKGSSQSSRGKKFL